MRQAPSIMRQAPNILRQTVIPKYTGSRDPGMLQKYSFLDGFGSRPEKGSSFQGYPIHLAHASQQRPG